MTGQDIVNSITDLREVINHCTKDLAKKGRQKAEAERVYRIALAKEIAIQRDAGTPVTIMSDVCRGNETIAKLKFERDIAADLYEIVKSKIYTSRMELDILITFYKTEFQNS